MQGDICDSPPILAGNYSSYPRPFVSFQVDWIAFRDSVGKAFHSSAPEVINRCRYDVDERV